MGEQLYTQLTRLFPLCAEVGCLTKLSLIHCARMRMASILRLNYRLLHHFPRLCACIQLLNSAQTSLGKDVVQQGEPVLWFSTHKAPEQNLSYNEAGPLIVPPGNFFPPPQILGVHSTYFWLKLRISSHCFVSAQGVPYISIKSTNSVKIELTKLSN